VLILGFLGAAGLGHEPPASAPLSPAPPTSAGSDFPWSAFAVSLVWISFSYSGWNAAVYVSGEIRDPERTVPRSLLLGTALVTILYVALNAVFVFAAPAKELAGRLEVGRIAARAVGGFVLEEAVAALIALVLVSSVSSLVMAGPRVYAKMAADGYLPAWLAMGDGPPRPAIALQAALALLLLWSASFDALLTTIGFTLGVSTAATVVALLVLRRREGEAVSIPGFPAVPGVFLIGVVGMTLFSIAQRPVESLVGFGTMLAGVAAWLVSRRAVRNARG
jgi:APA family basic amino acid/polyamine antiporter